MSIDQLLRYSVAFLIDSISNGYTLITIHELKPWVFFAFNIGFAELQLKSLRKYIVTNEAKMNPPPSPELGVSHKSLTVSKIILFK